MPGWTGFSTATELLNFLYRGTAITIGATLYLRLLVAPSSRSGGGTETTYTGYVRKALPRDASIFGIAGSNGRLTNSVQIVFPVATSLGNGDFVAFDIVDTASGAFTKVYNGGPVSPAKAVVVGKAPTFRIDALQITY